MRLILRLILLVALLAALALVLTRPRQDGPEALAGLSGDVKRGAAVFDAGGCAACHAAESAEGEARRLLEGGQRFPSPFGTFIAPNISPDPEHGIGKWQALDLWNAMHHGTSPAGRHYYPVFPYTGYIHASAQDVVDLHAYLMTLPASSRPNAAHEVGFPFNIRASLGLWKALFLREDWVVSGDLTAEQTRGRYLVEGLGHCGECHTPRNVMGGMDRGRWLAGAPNPGGKGRFPNITPGGLDWSEDDLVYYLTTGFTPEFDAAGGHMALVVANLARLDPADVKAIAAYLKFVPEVSGK